MSFEVHFDFICDANKTFLRPKSQFVKEGRTIPEGHSNSWIEKKQTDNAMAKNEKDTWHMTQKNSTHDTT